MDPLRIPSKGTAHSNKLSIFARVWPSMVAGLAGSVAHSSLMFLKYRAGFLPSFHPYDDLQRALSDLFGTSVHPAVSWVLSFANGALILGFLFARTYRLLPGRNGAVKGLVSRARMVCDGPVLFSTLRSRSFCHSSRARPVAQRILTPDGADLQHHAGHRVLRIATKAVLQVLKKTPQGSA